MEQFKIGDTVMLKSGGPLMTIRDESSNYADGSSNEWYCAWFDKNGVIKHEHFNKNTLRLVNETEN